MKYNVDLGGVDLTVLNDEHKSAVQKHIKDEFKPNILLIGGTGVGKSTLINTVLCSNLASVSNVRSETRGFHFYSSVNTGINFIDSEGYELGNEEYFKAEIKKEYEKRLLNSTSQIHVVWYCISLANSRVHTFDVNIISFMKNDLGLKVCTVITNCDSDTPNGDNAKELKKPLLLNFGSNFPCFEVSNNHELNKELELNQMLEWTVDCIDDNYLKVRFVLTQEANQKLKEKEADKEIKHIENSNFWKIVAKVPFARKAVEMYYVLVDSKTSINAKLIVASALAYFILPVDLVPDFIPFVGFADDAAAIAAAYAAISNQVTDEHVSKAEELLN